MDHEKRRHVLPPEDGLPAPALYSDAEEVLAEMDRRLRDRDSPDRSPIDQKKSFPRTGLNKGDKRRAILALVCDATLPQRAIAVGVFLLDHLNGKNLACFPSEGLLAAETGLSERTVRRGIADLKKANWCEPQRRLGTSSLYCWNWNKVAVVRSARKKRLEERKDQAEKAAGDAANTVAGHAATRMAGGAATRVADKPSYVSQNINLKEPPQKFSAVPPSGGEEDFLCPQVKEQISPLAPKDLPAAQFQLTAEPSESSLAKGDGGEIGDPIPPPAPPDRRQTNLMLPIRGGLNHRRNGMRFAMTAKNQAEGRWTTALCQQHPEMIERLTPEMTEAATRAELARPGAGLVVALEAVYAAA